MNIEINVTKIVKYVCVTGAVIVAIIFGQKHMQSIFMRKIGRNSKRFVSVTTAYE